MAAMQRDTRPAAARRGTRRTAGAGIAAAPLDLARRLPMLLAADAGPGTAYGAAIGPPGPRPQRAFPADRGHAKHCPVCRQAFGHYPSFGLDRRRNARCPGCGSLERHRFLWLYLERALGLPGRRLSILHIAPEPCIRNRLAGAPHLCYAAIDLYRPDAPLKMDATRLAFPDRCFDLVICSHVLEHVTDDRKALAEMARVLRPGGRAMILVPLDLRRPATHEDAGAASAEQRLAAFGHPYHVRLCGADYGERIGDAGFAVRRVDSAALSGHRRRYHRINKTSLFDCRRL
ncbi:MAG: methyltransferase domain-containing protein [Alphaproteobacteria bacterium]|nr:methyltransferase domain-containing protein [Alphaproteobacteria bacterium]